MTLELEKTRPPDPAVGRWLESVCDGRTRALVDRLVHERVEQWAELNPAAEAVRFLGTSLSYAELNSRANRLARHLVARGAMAGSRVVVCVEPAFDIVVALLGILKSGAVYVPVDPSYPPARVRAILEDTRPLVVITQQHLRARLGLDERTSITLTELEDTALPVDNLGIGVLPEHTAYIFYTSGTTGNPKGVMASHANLRHYVEVAEQRYALGNQDVMPALARYSFSISLFELMTPLAAGGTLLLLEREHVLDPSRLARTLGEVTIFHAGPSLLKALVAHVRRHYSSFEHFARVRHASSGGDMVPAELLESLKEIFANAEVFVIYGSSEISCMGCTYPVPRDRCVTTSYVGRPFDNVFVRVLGEDDRVLPAGTVGEIHFAGSGVTQGYLGLPELTSERFVELDGRRFYRTGDRGRLSREGWLEILGRNDFQTKIRGMRVELGEVEHELRRAPGVHEGVVSARATEDGEKTLVAYVVTERDDATPKPARIAAIRRHLLENLPDYMVPAVYVELERLPLNFNLKVDRRALPAPAEVDLRALAGMDLREPRTASERLLASLWQALLGVREVGLDDNFFELGGHSLLAIKLGLEVEQRLGVTLEGMDVLREPLEVLARICDERRGVFERRADSRSSALRRLEPVEVFHFGARQELYGVFHGVPGENIEQAVLLCAPVGQEAVRSRFILTRLARELAREGIPTLLFDYFGCGDSLGDSVEADLARWQADIAEAHAELGRRTRGARVTAVGVRLGALLLVQAAHRLALSKLVLWDPVHDGAEHCERLGSMQRAYLRSVAHLRFWVLDRGAPPTNELLGTTYSSSALRELGALTLAPLLAELDVPIRWLATSGAECEAALASNLGESIAALAVECVDLECGWGDLGALEDVIADAGISTALRAMVKVT